MIKWRRGEDKNKGRNIGKDSKIKGYLRGNIKIKHMRSFLSI